MKIKSKRKKAEYIESRKMIIEILKREANRPQKITLSHSKSGRLKIEGIRNQYHYSLSHCPEAILFAISQEAPVGVDIELIKPSRVNKTAAEMFMHEKELTAFKNESPDGIFFHQVWCMKESWYKLLKDNQQASFNYSENSIYESDSPFFFIKKIDNIALSVAQYHSRPEVDIIPIYTNDIFR